VELTNTGLIDLSHEADASLVVLVSYPGSEVSGICGVEIRADSIHRENRVGGLLTALNVTELQGTTLPIHARNAEVIDIDLPNGGFTYMLQIRTNDGKPLGETIQTALGGEPNDPRAVVLVARSCP
jgi:hypothetical protein